MTESTETERSFDEHPFKLTLRSDKRIGLYMSPFDMKFGDRDPTYKQTVGMAILFLQGVYNKL